jgi:hypothetical protein
MAAATETIQKEALFDARVMQPSPVRYAVQRGGLAVTAAPYNALSQSSSQHSYQVNV